MKPKTRSQSVGMIGLFGLLAILGLVYRIPFMLNPYDYNSDHAVVGLQALRFLEGDWQWFLWAVGYQSSWDSMLTAVVYKFFGTGPWHFQAVALLGYLVTLFFVFHTLAGRLSSLQAFLATSVLLFLSYIVNQFTVIPPRQWCFAFALFAIWLIDRASLKQRASLMVAGVFFAFFALYIDFLTIQFLPGALVFASLCAKGDRKLVKGLAIGFLAGGAFLAMSRLLLVPETNPPLAFSPKTFFSNVPLLLKQCLPALFNIWPGTWGKLSAGGLSTFYAILQFLGAVLIIGLALLGYGLSFKRKTLPFEIRRWGYYGFVIAMTSIGGFIGSSKASALDSARYLSPIFWTLPFVLAPVVVAWREVKFSKVLVPYLICAFIGGWVTSAPRVGEFLPARIASGHARDELKLKEFLINRGYHHAKAEYWIAYRLGHIFDESPLVIPREDWQDRYRPYKEEVKASQKVAEIYHPEDPAYSELRNALQIGRFRVILN